MNFNKCVKSIILALTLSTSALTSVAASAANTDVTNIADTASYIETEDSATSVSSVQTKLLTGFPLMKQAGKYDCWKTCIQATMVYKTGYLPSNSDFLTAGGHYYGATGNQPFLSRPDDNPDPNVLDMLISYDALPYMVGFFHGFPVAVANSRITNAEIKNNIDNNRPVLMRLSKSSGGDGHVVVMVGYRYNDSNPNVPTQVAFLDPKDGQIHYANLTFNDYYNVTIPLTSGDYFIWTGSILI